jgi:hypothetical protein
LFDCCRKISGKADAEVSRQLRKLIGSDSVPGRQELPAGKGISVLNYYNNPSFFINAMASMSMAPLSSVLTSVSPGAAVQLLP